ncbi:hypothetical protein ScPMuIL_000748 [Solemya velum]
MILEVGVLLAFVLQTGGHVMHSTPRDVQMIVDECHPCRVGGNTGSRRPNLSTPFVAPWDVFFDVSSSLLDRIRNEAVRYSNEHFYGYTEFLHGISFYDQVHILNNSSETGNKIACDAVRLYDGLVSVSVQLKTGNTREAIARSAESDYHQLANSIRNSLCYWKIITKTLNCRIPSRNCRRHLIFPDESSTSMKNIVFLGLRDAAIRLAAIIEDARFLQRVQ